MWCKSVIDIGGLFGKLVDCCFMDLCKFELYVVEGDLVGGFVKSGCDLMF